MFTVSELQIVLLKTPVCARCRGVYGKRASDSFAFATETKL